MLFIGRSVCCKLMLCRRLTSTYLGVLPRSSFKLPSWPLSTVLVSSAATFLHAPEPPWGGNILGTTCPIPSLPISQNAEDELPPCPVLMGLLVLHHQQMVTSPAQSWPPKHSQEGWRMPNCLQWLPGRSGACPQTKKLTLLVQEVLSLTELCKWRLLIPHRKRTFCKDIVPKSQEKSKKIKETSIHSIIYQILLSYMTMKARMGVGARTLPGIVQPGSSELPAARC